MFDLSTRCRLLIWYCRLSDDYRPVSMAYPRDHCCPHFAPPVTRSPLIAPTPRSSPAPCLFQGLVGRHWRRAISVLSCVGS